MAIIPFRSLNRVSCLDFFNHVKESEDVQTRVQRLVFSLEVSGSHLFEEGGQVIVLKEGGYFVRPVSQSHWFYRPLPFDCLEFKINNPDWNLHLQQWFLAHAS